MNEKTAGQKFYFLSLIFLASLVALSVTGCSKRYHDLPAFSAIPIHDAQNHSVGRFKTSYLADQLNAYFHGNINAPIAVATFVDIDNLYASSTFGRVVAEQLMSELAMRGYTVVEIRQSDVLNIMEGEGEFGLSRDAASLKANQELSGLVVGTYAISPVRVYLNVRVIDPRTAMVMSVGSVELGKDDEIRRLLRTNRLPYSLERMPIRQVGYQAYPLNSGYHYSYPAPKASFSNQPMNFDFEPTLPLAGDENSTPSNPQAIQPSLEPTT